MSEEAPDSQGNRRFTAWLRKTRIQVSNHWVGVIVGAAGAAVVFVGSVLGGGRTAIEFFYPKPDALSIAREQEQDRISREFLETVTQRLFLSRNYLARLQRRAAKQEISDAWTKLIASVERMSSRTLIYAISFGQFYSHSRRIEFELGIQKDFNRLTDEIVALRYSPAARKLEFADQASATLSKEEASQVDEDIERIRRGLDALNIRIYQFANCFDKQSQNSQGCKYVR